jgi:hypothetical protein
MRYFAKPSRSRPRWSVSGAPWPAKKISTVSSFFAERATKVPSAHLMFFSVGLRSVLSVMSRRAPYGSRRGRSGSRRSIPHRPRRSVAARWTDASTRRPRSRRPTAPVVVTGGRAQRRGETPTAAGASVLGTLSRGAGLGRPRHAEGQQPSGVYRAGRGRCPALRPGDTMPRWSRTIARGSHATSPALPPWSTRRPS